MLLSADVDTSLCSLYPELCEPNLSMQLRMFRSQNSYVNVNAAQNVLQSMHPEMRKLYPQVRLLLYAYLSSDVLHFREVIQQSAASQDLITNDNESESTECSCHLQHPSTPGGQHLC